MSENIDKTFIQALTNPSLYAHSTENISVIETHISWVILTGPYAYKIKKTVNLGFVDFSTISRRHFFCQEEIRLNSRLAPAIYLDVVPIYGTRKKPTFQCISPPIEYAVKMRQFPQDQLLSTLILKGELNTSHIDKLVERICTFHANIDKASDKSAQGSPRLINKQAQENFAPVNSVLDSSTLQNRAKKLQKWFEQEFTTHLQDFAARKKNGFVRECHGDMHLGNIIIQDNEAIIFDGIDFCKDFRWIDVASEVAFLTMDLEVHNRPDLAHRFINSYLEATGDFNLLKTFNFYRAYRALIRAKVGAIRLQQGHLKAIEEKNVRQELESYLKLAEKFTQPPEPQLFITHGLSASGKTYSTQAMIEKIGAIRIRSDVERKRLFGLKPLEKSADHPEIDLYASEITERTYDYLAKLASLILQAGFPVIVDATFLKYARRKTFFHLAKELNVPFTILHFEVEEDILRQRIIERNRQMNDASEADLNVLLKQQKTLESLTEEEKKFVLRCPE